MKINFIESLQLTSDIYEYRFTKPSNYSFIAGQFVELHILHSKPDNRGDKRWFTLSSSPSDSFLAITTRQSNKPSTFKQALNKLQKKDEITVSEPLGDFVLPRSTLKPLLFVALGIGITPFKSILTDLGNSHDRDITLIYAARESDNFIYLESLQKLASVKTYKGHVEPKTVLSSASKLISPQIYLSGPENIVNKLHAELSSKYSQSQLLCDNFPNYKIT